MHVIVILHEACSMPEQQIYHTEHHLLNVLSFNSGLEQSPSHDK